MTYSDAPEGFEAATEFSDAPPGFVLADRSIPFRPEIALQNAPRSAMNAATGFKEFMTNPTGVGHALGTAGPKKIVQGLKDRYGGWENIKRTAEQDPVGLAVDVGSVAFPSKLATSALSASKAYRLPRSMVREGDELLKTGGARMNEAKLNPAKVDAGDIAGPMQQFRDKLWTENAIDLNPQFVAPELMNRIRRLESAYAPGKRGAMYNLTKVEPGAKPPVSLSELHGHSKSLDTFINSTGKTEGRINEQGLIALELKKTIDEIVSVHPESSTFKIGKHEYHRGAMDRELNDLLERAKGRAQWKNGDEAGALSNEISLFLKAKKNRYKLTPEARRQLNQLSHDKRGRLVGFFGSTNPGGFTFARGAEMALGMWPGMLAPVGAVARQSRNARLLEEFTRIREQLRAGGPVR